MTLKTFLNDSVILLAAGALSVASLVLPVQAGAQASGSETQGSLIQAAPGGMALDIYQPARLPEEIVVMNPHGDVTITEFFDYYCHVCQRIGEELQQIAREDGNIRVVFREFPILNWQSSVVLSRLARSTYNQGIYLDVHNAFMEAHGHIDVDAAVKIIEDLGGDIRRLEADINDPQIIDILQSNVNFGSTRGLSATPSLMIGNQTMQGYPGRQRLLNMVAQLREEAAEKADR